MGRAKSLQLSDLVGLGHKYVAQAEFYRAHTCVPTKQDWTTKSLS